MVNRIEKAMKERRSLHTALTDLRASYQTRPSAELVRMIQQLEAEVAIRKSQPQQSR